MAAQLTKMIVSLLLSSGFAAQQEKLIHQCNLKIFFIVRNVKVIWLSQLNYVFRDIIKQPWKSSCENLQCFLTVMCRGQIRKGQMKKGPVTL